MSRSLAERLLHDDFNGLLEPASGLASSCGAEAGGLLQGLPSTVAELLLVWWHTTTDKAFLESKISRRQSWRVIWPLWSTITLASDTYGALTGSADFGFVFADLAFVVVTFAFAWYSFPIGSLRVDAVIGGLVGCGMFWQQQLMSASGGSTTVFGMVSFLEAIVCISFIGVHSLMSLFILLLCLVAMINAPMLLGDKMQILVLTVVVALGSVLLEFCMAFAFKEWQTESECNQRLLDLATDGFGVVCGSTGVLSQVSPKMAQTLGCDDPVGMQLHCFIEPRDHVALKNFFGHGTDGLDPQPVLVTCVSQTSFFEVRLVPYKLDRHSSHIGFCVQTVGEARSSYIPPPPPPRSRHMGQRIDAVAVSGLQPGGGSSQHLNTAGAAPEDAAGDVDLEGEQWMKMSSNEEGRGSHRSTSTFGAGSLGAGSLGAAGGGSLGGAGLSARGAGSNQLADSASGIFSLSSWTVSGPASASRGFAPRRKPVPTQTVAVQTVVTEKKRRPPVAPIGVSTYSKCKPILGPQSMSKGRTKVTVRLPPARVAEGISAFDEQRFVATPRSSRGNCLNNLVLSFNVAGSGCCAKHIAYMAAYDLIAEELSSHCSALNLHADWQCQSCFAVNSFSDDSQPGTHIDMSDELCPVCGALGEDILHERSPAQIYLPMDDLQSHVRSSSSGAEAGISA